MTTKELKRLSRRDLLELLVNFGEELENTKTKLASAQEQLEEQKLIIESNDSMAEKMEDYRLEAEELRDKLAIAEERLKDRRIAIEEAGSIAEASLQVNGVFGSAQQAADQYLDNIKMKNRELENLYAIREAESRAKADRIIMEAELRCAEMEDKAKTEADRAWREASSKLQDMIDSHAYLKRMLAFMELGYANE